MFFFTFQRILKNYNKAINIYEIYFLKIITYFFAYRQVTVLVPAELRKRY